MQMALMLLISRLKHQKANSAAAGTSREGRECYGSQ